MWKLYSVGNRQGCLVYIASQSTLRELDGVPDRDWNRGALTCGACKNGRSGGLCRIVSLVRGSFRAAGRN